MLNPVTLALFVEEILPADVSTPVEPAPTYGVVEECAHCGLPTTYDPLADEWLDVRDNNGCPESDNGQHEPF